MSKTSKKLTIIIICLLSLTFGLLYNKYTITSFLTDSGFDSSYDSGSSSSSDSGSSYSGSSSHDSYSSSSDGEHTPVELPKGGIVALIIVLIVIIILTNLNEGGSEETSDGVAFGHSDWQPPKQLKLHKLRAMSQEKFEKVISGVSLDKFLDDRTNDLIEIQNYWMNFDYDKLRDKLTDELYNQYEMQLKTLSIKGERNVMKDFKKIDYMVTNASNNNGKYEVTMELIISFIDYIEKDGKKVRGFSIAPITMHYQLVFVSSSNGIIDTCPSCGNKLNDTTTQVCPYCRNQITQDSTKWVLSKKVAKGQR